MRLSPHFTRDELTRSAKAVELGIDNRPTERQWYALGMLAGLVLEPARHLAGAPLEVTSGYRHPDLNRAIGGAAKSDHMSGQAADVKCASVTSEYLAARLYERRHLLPIRQCIWYAPERGGHLHLSIDLDALARGEAPRRQWLYAPTGGGYVPWAPR